MDNITLYIPPSIQITTDQFFELCQINELIKFERNTDGSMILKPLSGGITSNINGALTTQLANWNDDKSQGIVFLVLMSGLFYQMVRFALLVLLG